jgi:hypothetical protein
MFRYLLNASELINRANCFNNNSCRSGRLVTRVADGGCVAAIGHNGRGVTPLAEPIDAVSTGAQVSFFETLKPLKSNFKYFLFFYPIQLSFQQYARFHPLILFEKNPNNFAGKRTSSR